MLLWQHAWFLSPAPWKWNITICDSTRQNTWSYLRHMPVPPSLGLLLNIFNCIFCPVQLQMVIFYFKEEGTGTKYVAIATSKCVPSSIFLKVQHSYQVSIASCFIIGRDILNFVSHHCPCTTDGVINGWICIIGKLEFLLNEKRYHKTKNAISLYSEKTSKLAYFWNDLFFGSCAL